MADHDPWNWTAIGTALGGLATGLGAALGIRRRPRSAADDKMRAEIRTLQDMTLRMQKDQEAMAKALAEEVENRKSLEEKHERLLSGIFGEMKTMSNTLIEIKTEVRIALTERHE